MNQYLKGNFKTKNAVSDEEQAVDTLEQRFEKEAKKRLGGSIAYVAKKKVLWDLKDD